MSLVSFLRGWAVTALGCLPLLVLLLIPQLMRSRAGSESLLMIGMLLLFALLIAGVVLAPVLSAIAAPVDGTWQPRTALRSARDVWRRRAGQAWLALGMLVVVYGAGQAVGYLLAEAVPYVHDNPASATDPSAPLWVIDYPAYVLQALVIYAFTTLAITAYGARLRALAIGLARSTTDGVLSGGSFSSASS
ncbi:hypothetical protein MUN74_04325 [Agromyces endophyticus]|uniref:hypothetical protein n=1 Tax=Agromyces sp. H17E-10 TaxID=2932244 RepID=UPI001FD4B6D0|nr:hypothetical protein [Agromyces sp. H17E-10]UOQ90150.1 hypothetical protein MUN74_04325 [Agromyces sp. H17E-10]